MNDRGREIREQLGDDRGGVAIGAPDEELTTADMAGRPQRPAEPAPQRSEESGQAASGDEHDDRPAPLFPAERADAYREHWRTVQTAFVDDPRNAVQDADRLVAQVMKELAETFASERSQLEGQWSRGDDVSTEDLRVALQRYRSFFQRLLSL